MQRVFFKILKNHLFKFSLTQQRIDSVVKDWNEGQNENGIGDLQASSSELLNVKNYTRCKSYNTSDWQVAQSLLKKIKQ
jgi:hypothetical protein